VTREADRSAAVAWVLAGNLVASIGTGLVLPLLVVYLHDIRGFSTRIAGLVVASSAVAGLAAAPLAGRLIDRFGPVVSSAVGLAVEGIGIALWAEVTEVWHAFVVAALLPVVRALIFPGLSTTLARLVPEERRQRVFAFQFMLLNLGIGIGGMLSAAFADRERPETFEWMYRVSGAAPFVFGAAFLVVLRRVGRLRAVDLAAEHAGREGSFADVLRDHKARLFLLTSVVLMTFGYGQVEVGLATWTIHYAGHDVRLVAWEFVANTLTIVVGQLFVLRLIDGRSRTRTFALVGVVWAGAWVLFAAAGLVPGTTPAVVLLILGATVFAVGETAWTPVAPSLINDIAPEHIRGRYNALASMSWGAGTALGAALTGQLLGAGGAWAVVWVGCVVLGPLVASLLALRLGRELTARQDGRFADAAVQR
jgi:MFS family permease